MNITSADPGTVPEPATLGSNAKPPLWRRAWFLIVTAIGVIGLSLFVRFGIIVFVVQPVKCQGSSMEPALRDGDRLMLKKMVGELARGDIVAFRYPESTSKSFMKRIIALPGETISIDVSGVVSINNSELSEPYVASERNRSPRAVAKTTLAAGEYFVMGDARDASNDSRVWGPVDGKLIYGKVIWRYWPITR